MIDRWLHRAVEVIGERKAMEENFKGQCGWGGRLRAPAREEDGVGSEGGRRRGARDEEEAGSQNMKGNAAGGSTSRAGPGMWVWVWV